MRIVHVLPYLEPGGAQRVAIALARSAAAAGHEVRFVLGWRYTGPGSLDADIPPGVPVHYISDVPLGRVSRFLAGARWAGRADAFALDADVVHSHLTLGAFIATLVGFRRRGARR